MAKSASIPKDNVTAANVTSTVAMTVEARCAEAAGGAEVKKIDASKNHVSPRMDKRKKITQVEGRTGVPDSVVDKTDTLLGIADGWKNDNNKIILTGAQVTISAETATHAHKKSGGRGRRTGQVADQLAPGDRRGLVAQTNDEPAVVEAPNNNRDTKTDKATTNRAKTTAVANAEKAEEITAIKEVVVAKMTNRGHKKVAAVGTAQAREQDTSTTGHLADTVAEAEMVGVDRSVDRMTSAPNIIAAGDKAEKAVGSTDAATANLANGEAERVAGCMDAMIAEIANDSGLNPNAAMHWSWG
mmetsp:Transcript_19048/g.35542  ORF Transcript_19048/g.35542 Transcript_19048/m.35542 type:complete len:300 (-) Transcript_19048:794-1693(-)